MRVLITGATGQDGAIKAFQSWVRGDEVHVLARRRIDNTLGKLDEVISREPDLGRDVVVHYVDLTEYEKVMSLIQEIKPERIYHFAAQSFVPFSFDNPIYTLMVNVGATYAILEAVRKYTPSTEVFIPSSSEVFGGVDEHPQTMETRYEPVSPYALTKVDMIYMGRIYRRLGLRVYVGILYNHESELRSREFVTMKIVYSLARDGRVVLGNTSAMKDWGYAPEYMKIIDRYMGSDGKYEFMVCTGKLASVADFANYVMDLLGLNDREKRVVTDASLVRPVDTKPMTCDTSRIDYVPSLDWRDVARIMVDYVTKGRMELLMWF